jgi:uncharacterized protein YecE (DUF72 family)
MRNHQADNPFPPNLLIGADGWNWDDWVGGLYPEGTAKADYLAEYSRHYPIVEVDSTFYRIPTKVTVKKWVEQTPENFIFAAKVPQGVTHRAFQGDFRGRLAYFLEVMETFGQKLGPLLFQFPYYKQSIFPSVTAFLDKFEPLLASLPTDLRFAVEVRNSNWITAELFERLRKYHVAFTLVDHPWAEKADELMKRMDVVTSDFCYIRWLGHQTKLDKMTDRWDHLLLDKREETSQWVKILSELLRRDVKTIFGIYRNRYAGYAPGSIELLKELWRQDTGV